MKEIILVAKSQDDVNQILYSKTEEWDPRNFRLWVPETVVKSQKRYYGSVVGNRFKVLPLIPGRNFLTPIISGETEKADDHVTRVVCSIHASPFAYPAIAISVLVGISSFVSPLEKLFSGGLCTLVDWVYPVEGCILMFGFLLANYISKKKHSKQFVNFMKDSTSPNP